MKCNAFTDPQTGKTIKMVSPTDIMGYADRVCKNLMFNDKGYLIYSRIESNDNLIAFKYTDMEPKDDD